MIANKDSASPRLLQQAQRGIVVVPAEDARRRAGAAAASSARAKP